MYRISNYITNDELDDIKYSVSENSANNTFIASGIEDESNAISSGATYSEGITNTDEFSNLSSNIRFSDSNIESDDLSNLECDDIDSNNSLKMHHLIFHKCL